MNWWMLDHPFTNTMYCQFSERLSECKTGIVKLPCIKDGLKPTSGIKQSSGIMVYLRLPGLSVVDFFVVVIAVAMKWECSIFSSTNMNFSQLRMR